jgi:dihydrofolate synthase/folylpolyglutamate synthase
MSLPDQLTALYARRRFGIKPGTERVQRLLERLGSPQRSFPVIHVVGTNGKGSTAAFLSSILSAAGLRTALFTSPHLVAFNERLRINGTEIGDEQLSLLLAEVLAHTTEEETFFEIVTALALLYFARERVDVAVLEAGMGGRSDATSICHGFMTLLTPVSLDHTDYLGTTIEQIAREKAGIAKPGSRLLAGTQPDTIRQALTESSDTTGNTVWLADMVSAAWNEDDSFDYRGIDTSFTGLVPGIGGRYQLDNASLALMAAEYLIRDNWQIAVTALRSGICTARWPGRMEYISGTPPLLLDGAHNQAGMAALWRSLTVMKQHRQFIVVIGVMADKELAPMLALLPQSVARCYCVAPAIERAMPPDQLQQAIASHGIAASSCESVAAGIAQAQRESSPGDLVVVCGSLFTVGEAKAWLEGRLFQGIRG